eukprot:Rhum_TRINITY_DN14889_c10_g1::Rhum_TRINITY_DN14889_c10_g1_i1::g.126410::m.126410/K19944/TBC1D10; TBC1 domain family member 10
MAGALSPQSVGSPGKVDDFGFICEDGDVSYLDAKKENERLEKWSKMFADWDRSVKSGKVKERIRKGIPKACRAEAWIRLTGARAAQKRATPGLYEQCVAKEEAVSKETRSVIFRDLHRTLPNHSLFQDTEAGGQATLRRILTAFAAHDPEVDYVQGIGFVVSILLVAGIPEELCFWTLVCLMTDRPDPVTKEPCKYHLRRLYLPGFPELKKMQFQLNGLLDRFLPALAAHFREQEVDCAMCASQWFLTLYVYQFPNHPYLLLRILDTFMYEGWKIMYRVAIALLKLEQEALMKMPMDQIYPHLKKLQSNHHPNVVMKEMLALSLKREHIDKVGEVYEQAKLRSPAKP